MLLHAPRDTRFERLPDPRDRPPTDVIVRIARVASAAWTSARIRGVQTIAAPMPMRHEHCSVEARTRWRQSSAE
jgi:hypothetical protein